MLTEQRGLDGFTMDELAEVADVSRRTLFNYFPGKDAAVLGPEPDLAPDLVAEFVQGGPHGHLLDDIAALAVGIMRNEEFDREDVARIHRILQDNPRLFAAAKKRFEDRAEEFVGLIQQREGAAYDELRARVAVHVTGALVDLALDAYVDLPDAELADLFTQSIRLARTVFA